ncbi:plipastatin synthase subunit A-like [Mercenaria mercenaria]|uniref:plipastatin synthase subunit A-like n=1 Tax=Mercenaria mercenaria TaxID=6596 RepID=UPI00234F7083|nr:plipastatin synthase subunit A-like [Mercenaria mercenaria]XP_045200413.2 plipastatin synthase subunit A-like [Mercenaria mercenaria]
MGTLFSSLKKRNEENYVTKRKSPHLSSSTILGRSVKEIDMSVAQRRILVFQNAVPDSTAYTITIALSNDTNIEPEPILKELVRRHPILLASYNPTRNVLSIAIENISTVISPFVTVNSTSELKKYIDETIPAFNMTDGVLSQMKVIACGKTKMFVIHVHHIIADEVTVQNMKTTLEQLLQNPPSNVQFDTEDLFLCSTATESEKEYILSEDFAADKLFWEKEFEDCPDSSSLSFRHISDISDFEAHTANTVLSFLSDSSQQILERFLKLHGLTKFQVFLALFVLVLQRYLGSPDVLVAIPVSTRDAQTTTVDGLFVNMVLFRYTINLNDSFEEHVLNVARRWLTVFKHSRYPLEKVSEMIWCKNGKNLECLCRVMFIYKAFSSDKEEMRIHAKHAKTEFLIEISDEIEGGKIHCEYAEKLIDQGISKRLVQTLRDVCNNFNTLGERKLRFIEFLTEEEMTILEDFTETEKIDQAKESVYEMFFRNTKTAPSKTALVHKGKKFTYSDILDLSDGIALQILNCVDFNRIEAQPILLLMEKNEIAISAIFAIWKLGGFFMPISVLHVPSITEAIEKANPCLILLNDDRFEKEASNSKCNIVCLKKSLGRSVSAFHAYKQPFDRDLRKPAYLIQTSGSTGKPKHIKISQMSLSIVAAAWINVYELQTTDVNVLQWAPLSFDVFIGDIVRGMCGTAGKVCICPEENRLEIDYIKDMIKTEQITLAEFTPQFSLTLVEHSNAEELNSLKILILGSDVLQTEVYKKVKNCLHRDQRLLNSYGMSEATIDSSYFEGENLPITRGGTVPIGKPLPGVRMKVLEPETLRPCPVGTLGELFIGGRVLGSGDTDVVTLPSGEVMLKTNDRACWLPSGDLELFGRLNSVCKLRGFRICTTEIENTILMTCSFVGEVTVAVLTTGRNGSEMQLLCAFVVLENRQELTDTGKRKIVQSVKARHPYYMVPDLITAVDRIPLTTNGKVNHTALPSVVDLLHSPNTDEETELSETVVILRQIFADILGLDSSLVDTRRTFFEQGGNSLLLVQFHSLIKRKTDYDISLADIFSYPSLKSLADSIEDKMTQTKNLNNDT